MSHHCQRWQYSQRLLCYLKITLVDSSVESNSGFTVGEEVVVGWGCGRFAEKTGWRKVGSLTDAGFRS